MSTMQNKLRSSRGASMLLALLFLLVCLMVGAVTLTASAANTGRIQRNRQEQQAYLAVASAAKLLREELTAMKFVGEYEKTVETVYHPDTPNPEGTDTDVTISYTSSTSLTGSDLVTLEILGCGDSYHYYEGKDGATREAPSVNTDYPKTSSPGAVQTMRRSNVTIEVKDQVEVDGRTEEKVLMPCVKGAVYSCVRDGGSFPRYTILVELGTEDGQNTMTLQFAPTVSRRTKSTSSGDTVITTYTTEVTWEDCVITKGELQCP